MIFEKPLITPIYDELFIKKSVQVDMLRLDLIHPNISGNKWYKLKHNIEAAKQLQAKQILSFGGAYSNHLHALAFAGKMFDFNTIGFVRGEAVANPTLDDCQRWGMKIHFMAREDYRQKNEKQFLHQIALQFPDAFIIPEGGDNELGKKGCSEILSAATKGYDYIVCSVGTGTTLAGLMESTAPKQSLIGFVVLKNGFYLQHQIQQKARHQHGQLQHDYHFGGFGKSTSILLDFMKTFQQKNNIELDKVYTAKMMFGLFDMIQNNKFENNTSILALHTGGLQGNRSDSFL
jgi:1-aminocyclopropane-1-carboxylate deaminase